jgi:hypothetical protein
MQETFFSLPWKAVVLTTGSFRSPTINPDGLMLRREVEASQNRVKLEAGKSPTILC